MSFRLKFLLTLLAFSLLPLALVSSVTLQSLQHQGKKFAEISSSELTDIVRSELLTSVVDYADSLKGAERSLWFALTLLKQAAQQALQEPPPDGMKTYRASDFDAIETAPEDLKPLSQLHELAGKGPTGQTLASLGHPAMLPPPAAPQNNLDLQRRMRQLASLQDVQKKLFTRLGPDGFQQYICLTNGLCSVYPGHGGFPSDYFGIDSPWYINTRMDSGSTWSGPLEDPVFGASLYMLSTPLEDENGNVLGVAALDYPLSNLLQEQRFTSKWSDAAHSYMVAMRKDPETGQTGLLVFARRDYKDGAAATSQGMQKYDWLRSNDAAGFARLLQDMQASESGVHELPLEGETSLWAFARYAEEDGMPTYAMLTLPKSVFMDLPESFSSQAISMFKQQGLIALATLLLAAGLVTLVALLGARSVTRQLLEISNAARRLSQGDFSVRLSLELHDERQELVNVINELGPRLARYMELRQSLEVAQEVQKSLLPDKAPDLSGFDMAGVSLYCDETGGDYFDFLQDMQTSTPNCAVLIGDVTGHGIPSALLMATARAMFHGLMPLDIPLAERMTMINRLLAQDLFGTGRFMTMFLVELEQNSSQVRFIRAGHDPALVYRPQQDDFIELSGQGLPLGVLEDYVYEQCTEDCMEPGCILVMGTDGIWETMREHSQGHSELFGKERLCDIVRQNAHLPAQTITQAVLDAVAAFRGAGRQSDDITMTVIKRL